MVTLLEPVCYSWVHEEVNAGFLKLVSESCQDNITYIGERQHVKCVSKIYKSSKVFYKQITELKVGDDPDNYKNTIYYFNIINDAIRKCHPSKMFILCAYRPCILAAEMASLISKSFKIYVMLHGMVEEHKGKTGSYRKLFQLSKYCNNVCFMTYSPFCTADYWNIPANKMIFFHHPYIEAKRRMGKSYNSDNIVIGIIGACANDKAVRLIHRINMMEEKGKYEFWVLSRFAKKFSGLPHTRILDLEFDRKCVEQVMSQMDYMLLPYGRQEYAISASGVLWDAVSNKVPCIMLDSRYFEYYQPNKIGYHAKSIQELGEIISKIITDGNRDKDKGFFFTELEQLENYNYKMIKSLLD